MTKRTRCPSCARRRLERDEAVRRCRDVGRELDEARVDRSALETRLAARGELAAEAADHQAACERLLSAERERAERMQEQLEQKLELLGEWLAAWERTAEGDRVRATERVLRGEE